MAKVKDEMLNEQEFLHKELLETGLPIDLDYYESEVERIKNNNERALNPGDGSSPWDRNPFD